MLFSGWRANKRKKQDGADKIRKGNEKCHEKGFFGGSGVGNSTACIWQQKKSQPTTQTKKTGCRAYYFYIQADFPFTFEIIMDIFSVPRSPLSETPVSYFSMNEELQMNVCSEHTSILYFFHAWFVLIDACARLFPDNCYMRDISCRNKCM